MLDAKLEVAEAAAKAMSKALDLKSAQFDEHEPKCQYLVYASTAYIAQLVKPNNVHMCFTERSSRK
jgi:hypothetical protein